MLFEDISHFENMSDDELKAMIQQANRKTATIFDPRSAMMLNPLKLKHLNRIDDLKADIIVINLEDGVAPVMKRRALLLSAVFISHLKKSNSKIVVRVNPIDEGGDEEIRVLNKVLPDSIRVAKIRDKRDVKKAIKLLDPSIKLHLSIETKEALYNLKDLNIENRVKCASLGIMDMLNSFGLPQSLLNRNNPTIHYILSKFLLDSKMANIYPIGFTYQKYNDLKGFREWCEFEKSLGYSSKSCLGPKQVDIANDVFGISDDEMQRAKKIKKSFEESLKEGVSGFMDEEFGFIDEPIYKDAILILDKIGKFR